MDAADIAKLYRETMGDEKADRQEALASCMKTGACACAYLPGEKPANGHKLGCPHGVAKAIRVSGRP